MLKGFILIFYNIGNMIEIILYYELQFKIVKELQNNYKFILATILMSTLA